MNVIWAFIRNRRVLCTDVRFVIKATADGFADKQREKVQVERQD